jgi:hypothetical protein
MFDDGLESQPQQDPSVALHESHVSSMQTKDTPSNIQLLLHR